MSAPPPDVVRLPGVTVELHRGWTRTAFDDGAVCTAVAQHDPESIARARSLGYAGTDAEAAEAMTREHDLLHSFAAYLVLGKGCPVLRDVAVGSGGRIAGARDVEAAILGLQAFLNSQVRPALLAAEGGEGGRRAGA